jgi:hypothetical protein
MVQPRRDGSAAAGVFPNPLLDARVVAILRGTVTGSFGFPLSRAPLAGVLLLLQAAAGGAVTLADASEPLTAASHIEARHEPACPVLHDVSRCALCHYAGTRVVVQQTPVTPPARPQVIAAPRRDVVPVVAADVRLTAPARAPPALLS